MFTIDRNPWAEEAPTSAEVCLCLIDDSTEEVFYTPPSRKRESATKIIE